MTLSEADKQRIRAEEEERLKARDEIAVQKQKKNTKPVLIGCGILAAVIFLIFIIIAVAGGGSKSSTPKDITLNANVYFTGTQFRISNNDDFDWVDVKFELNSPGLFSSGYILKADQIAANTVYTVGAAQFAMPDGTRFNPFSMKPVSFSIVCAAGNDKGYYSAEWK